MKIAYLERAWISGGFLEQSSASGIAALFRNLLLRGSTHHGKPHELSEWQLIFLQSKVNGCIYHGDELPPTQWNWPSNTWLQIRLNHLKQFDPGLPAHISGNRYYPRYSGPSNKATLPTHCRPTLPPNT